MMYWEIGNIIFCTFGFSWCVHHSIDHLDMEEVFALYGGIIFFLGIGNCVCFLCHMTSRIQILPESKIETTWQLAVGFGF